MNREERRRQSRASAKQQVESMDPKARELIERALAGGAGPAEVSRMDIVLEHISMDFAEERDPEGATMLYWLRLTATHGLWRYRVPIDPVAMAHFRRVVISIGQPDDQADEEPVAEQTEGGVILP